MKIAVDKVITMVKQGPFNKDLFDFSAYNKRLAEIRKQKASPTSEQKVQVENVPRKMDMNELMTNQLSVLQDIQYHLSEMEKNTKKKRRWFSRNKEA